MNIFEYLGVRLKLSEEVNYGFLNCLQDGYDYLYPLLYG